MLSVPPQTPGLAVDSRTRPTVKIVMFRVIEGLAAVISQTGYTVVSLRVVQAPGR